jgi:uncharacterized protein (TIGR03905 family)
MSLRQSIKSKGGICAPQIDFEVDDNNIVHNVRFWGGCSGNSKGLSALVEGMAVAEVIRRLRGIQCRNGTSCPDQLAQALANLDGKKE